MPKANAFRLSLSACTLKTDQVLVLYNQRQAVEIIILVVMALVTVSERYCCIKINFKSFWW